MGTGKTAVAKGLAKTLGMRYVSTDEVIEAREGMPISDIFSTKGEPYFRQRESEVVCEVSGQSNAVVDAGGGIVAREENVRALKKCGVLVCLTARPEVILKRTRHATHRPLLNVKDPRAKIEELLDARSPLYAKADVQIDTSDLTVAGVVEKIAAIFQKQ